MLGQVFARNSRPVRLAAWGTAIAALAAWNWYDAKKIEAFTPEEHAKWNSKIKGGPTVST